MRRIRSIWFICEDSSIAATQLEGKRRGVLSSYDESKGCGMRRMSMSDLRFMINIGITVLSDANESNEQP